MPRDIEDLTSLAGLAERQPMYLGNIFGEPSIVVDTHVKRISNRLGLTKYEDPVKIEFDLMDKLPKEQWILYNIQIITLGRSICTARSPNVRIVLINDCPYGKEMLKKKIKKDKSLEGMMKIE